MEGINAAPTASHPDSIDVSPDKYDAELMKIEANASDGELENLRGQQQYLQHNFLERIKANNDADPEQ